MATLVLQTVGAVVGGAVAGPLGAIAGRALGALAGAAIDNALLSDRDSGKVVEGPRLKDVDGLTSTEGAPIPRVFGRARLGGQIVWATRLIEEANTAVERSGESGGKSIGGGGAKTTSTTYSYFANLAVGLCEGPIAYVRRVFADGKEVDLSTIAMRVHAGSESQSADPLIVAKEDAARAPAYRGLAYVVFERLPLAPFGNRIPQFSFEVIRPVDGLAKMVRAVCLIPGATEFGYCDTPVSQVLGLGATRSENRHQLRRPTDVLASLDALEALCPNVEAVSLVVSWFGDDLRAGACTVKPKVDVVVKETDGATWSVAGITRASAEPVSLAAGTPAYGGTPSDESVVRLIGELKKRGLSVILYPFLMMDVPAGNALPDPYGGSGQPPYPWRGRIACHPAPGEAGSPDGGAAAATQVATFFTRPDGYAAMVTHCASLAAQAGGVDGFIIGSEFVGLTRVRSASGVYPAAAQLKALATSVRAIVGTTTKLVYAADWTEYGAHVRSGGAEVRFPLDPLFAHADIDAVGIDFYPPISDWRDGGSHADLAEARSAYDVDYLRKRLGAGEAFDWYYADTADRNAQVRTPITDGAFGKPWVFRAKDLVSWWSNAHVERLGGDEIGTTAWVPQSKPIWLTEIGVPAVDKGANGPNVFPDPKSSESAAPPFSTGARDDLAQARALEAIVSRFDPGAAGFQAASNPVSSVYGKRMVEPSRVFVWAWDARPFPAFPDLGDVWADGGNWEAGHWITGRIEGVPLDRLVKAILTDFGLAAGLPASLPLDGFCDGYVVDRPMSARAALEPLARLYGFDAVASGGGLVFAGRGGRSVVEVAGDDLLVVGEEPSLRLSRTQETDLPYQVEFGFTDGENEYRRAAVASRRLVGSSRREARADAAVVTRRAEAQRLADGWLQDLWAGRESAAFALSPRRIEIEAGDVLAVPTASGQRLHRVVRIADGPTRRLETRAIEPAVYERPGARLPRPKKKPPPIPGKPAVAILDLPAVFGEPTVLQWLAVAADPWPGSAAIFRSSDGVAYRLHRYAPLKAMLGVTLNALPPGPLWRFDRRASLDVQLSSGSLASLTDEAALAGDNLFAVRGPDGRFEIIAAATAELVGVSTWRLSRLLRGLFGTEPEAARTLAPGALLVRLDEALVPLTSDLSDLGGAFKWRVGPAGRDHADASYLTLAATVSREALKPYAPVRLSARRTAEGILVSFIRRTRRDGDAWEADEVPLGESVESYLLDIRQAGVVKRTLAAGAPAILYPAAAETADFGGPQSVIEVALAQVSATVGRGFSRVATLPVL